MALGEHSRGLDRTDSKLLTVQGRVGPTPACCGQAASFAGAAAAASLRLDLTLEEAKILWCRVFFCCSRGKA